MKKYLLPLILIICLAFSLSGYSADLFGTYDQRIKLTIDNTKIDSDLTWFPVTVFLDNAQAEEVFTELPPAEDFDRVACPLQKAVAIYLLKETLESLEESFRQDLWFRTRI